MIVIRGCSFPEELYYHPQHNVWLKGGEDGVVTLGATSFGVALAGEFVAFVPKLIGTRVDADRAVGLLELAKTLTSVRSPAGGTIVASNDAAVADPGIINRDPYGDGWLIKLKVENWSVAARTLVTGASIRPAFDEAMRLENFEGSQG